MRLAIGALYVEPGVDFEVSHIVVKHIRSALERHVIVPYGLFPEADGIWLSLLISTRKTLDKVEARGPSKDRKNKCLTWGLWLPYHEVTDSPNPLETFIDRFFDAAGMVFDTYGVSRADIMKAQAEVKLEVLL
jgi:hypothetical protein